MKNSISNEQVLDNLIEDLNINGISVAIEDTFVDVDNVVALSCTGAGGGNCGGGSGIREL